MGVHRHQTLSDSIQSHNLKKREAKANQKIVASIDKIQAAYRHMRVYE